MRQDYLLSSCLRCGERGFWGADSSLQHSWEWIECLHCEARTKEVTLDFPGAEYQNCREARQELARRWNNGEIVTTAASASDSASSDTASKPDADAT